MNNSEKKEELYLTSTNINNKENESYNSIINEKFSPQYYSKKKKILFLPPINNKLIKRIKNNTSIFDSITEEKEEISNANSYFIPENYLEYSESCNKFERKIDPLLKEKLSPKNVLMKNRRYDNNEKNMLSDLYKEEMIHRSAGQGMFIRIKKYSQLYKKKPYHPIYIKQYNDNERYIKKNKINDYEKSKKKENRFNGSSDKLGKIPIYLREKEFNPEFRERPSVIKPFNELLNSFRPPSFIYKRKKKLNKGSNLINKIRDQKIIMALMRSGDEDLKFNIGPNFN